MKWIATFFLIIGMIINNLGYYPFGAIIMLIGTTFWFIVSIKWNENALIVTNGIMLVLGVLSLLIGIL